jgi:hypothetical protein
MKRPNLMATLTLLTSLLAAGCGGGGGDGGGGDGGGGAGNGGGPPTGDPPPATGALACSPWAVARGTEVRTTYANPNQPLSDGETIFSANGPATFDGRAATELRLIQPLGPATLDVRLYGSPDAATGAVTAFGSISVASVSVGGSSITSTSQVVLNPPALDLEFTLAPGQTAPERTTTQTETRVDAQDGVAQPPVVATTHETFAAVTFVGLETVSVPAGTFRTCRFSDAGSPATTRWTLVGYGSPVKDSTGGQATQIRVNGAPITGN